MTSSHDVLIGLFFDNIPLSSCFVTRFREKSSKKSQPRFKNRKNQLFSIFTVDHFSRLLPAQNTPKIFFGRFAQKLKKNQFSRFSPLNPIIHYSKNPKNPASIPQIELRKSKKVIFWSKPSYPEPWSLLVAFSKKSRFPHVS